MNPYDEARGRLRPAGHFASGRLSPRLHSPHKIAPLKLAQIAPVASSLASKRVYYTKRQTKEGRKNERKTEKRKKPEGRRKEGKNEKKEREKGRKEEKLKDERKKK